MQNELMTNKILRDQELYRAKEIVKVAERDEKNVGKTLRDYGVASTIIDELGIELVKHTPKVKQISAQEKIEQWAKENVGRTINGGKQIAEELGISYPTANSFVQTRRDYFSKVKKGEYIVKDAEADRLASKNS